MVHLRAKCRRIAAVALRNALWGSLSHYPSLRILRLEGLSTVSLPYRFFLGRAFFLGLATAQPAFLAGRWRGFSAALA